MTSRSAERGFGNLALFVRRYGAAIMLVMSLGSPAASFYLTSTFARRDYVDAAITAVTQLIYSRTKPINERVGTLESNFKSIETKLDAASKLEDERARRAETDNAQILTDLREIRSALLGPRESANVRTTR